LEAFQEPVPTARPPARIFQEPDMELPATDPEYVIDSEPTVPNLIEAPLRLPLMLVGTLPNPEIAIVPLSFDFASFHVSLNVPVNEPL
jgi:hypothetical protein